METIRILLKAERREISYIQWIIESYDGMAVMRTVDPQEAIIELMISPGCESLVLEILDHLNKHEKINLSKF